MASMSSTWSKAGGEQEGADGKRVGGWQEVLFLRISAPANLLNPQLFGDPTLPNEAMELGAGWVPSPCSKSSTLALNQKWEVKLEVEIRATLFNFK